MRTFVVCTSLLLAATLPAQRGVFAISPDSGFVGDFFIDRGATSTSGNPGEILAEMPRGLAGGLGTNSAGTCRMLGLLLNLQDENAATAETFGVVGRARAASGTGPNRTATIFAGGGLQTPTGTGRLAWVFTINFQTGGAVLPCNDWFFGASLPALRSATDGLWPQLAHYTLGTYGDNPRAGAPNLAWSIDTTAAQLQSHPWVWSVGLLPAGPTIQFGANDPNTTRINPTLNQGTTTFGAGGFFPNVSGTGRADGLDVRIMDAQNGGAVTSVLFAFGIAATPITFTGVLGQLYLDPVTLFAFPGGTISTTQPRQARGVFLPAGTIPSSLAGTGARAYIQAAVLDQTNGLTLGNWVGVDF